MKLYTEEQVRKAYNEGCWNGFNEVSDKEDFTINSLKPIELPSYEEIETKIENMEGISLEIEVGYRAGARWMRNKIINR